MAVLTQGAPFTLHEFESDSDPLGESEVDIDVTHCGEFGLAIVVGGEDGFVGVLWLLLVLELPRAVYHVLCSSSFVLLPSLS
jgi:hypothetical protein